MNRMPQRKLDEEWEDDMRDILGEGKEIGDSNNAQGALAQMKVPHQYSSLPSGALALRGECAGSVRMQHGGARTVSAALLRRVFPCLPLLLSLISVPYCFPLD